MRKAIEITQTHRLYHYQHKRSNTLIFIKALTKLMIVRVTIEIDTTQHYRLRSNQLNNLKTNSDLLSRNFLQLSLQTIFHLMCELGNDKATIGVMGDLDIK